MYAGIDINENSSFRFECHDDNQKQEDKETFFLFFTIIHFYSSISKHIITLMIIDLSLSISFCLRFVFLQI